MLLSTTYKATYSWWFNQRMSVTLTTVANVTSNQLRMALTQESVDLGQVKIMTKGIRWDAPYVVSHPHPSHAQSKGDHHVRKGLALQTPQVSL